MSACTVSSSKSSSGCQCYSVIMLVMLVRVIDCVHESEVYSTRPCDILNTPLKIPCIQHVFVHQSAYCNSEKLQELFPHLYSIPDSTMKFPGPARLLEPSYSNVTWRARNDGSVYFLKGFQVLQTGRDFDTYLNIQCAVIDISNITEVQFTNLPNITFSVDFKMPGLYSAEVRSLPLGNKDNVESVDLNQDPMFEEYHPKLNISFNYWQTNETCVNISLLILPKIEGIDKIVIDTDYNGINQQNQSGLIPYAVMQYIPLCDLMVGNYTMKISLLDKSYFDGSGKCVCYKGTPDVHTCLPSCKTYSQTFHVTKYKQPIRSLHEGNRALTITMAILCPILVITIVMGVLLGVYRHRGNRLPFIGKKSRKLKQEDSTPILCIVYSEDHEPHSKVIQTFIQMVEATCNWSVKTLNCTTNKTCTESFLLDTTASHDILKDSDVIIVVHSEYLHYLISESETILQQTDRRNMTDICTIEAIVNIQQNHTLIQKTVSIYFEYTEKPFINLLGSESLFYLPLQSGNLRQHLLHEINMTETMANNESNLKEKENQFISAVNSACVYQEYHPNWMTVKLFNMQNSYSSDDSGIIVSNRRIKRQRSVRSKSADTVCKCGMYQPTNDCSNCNKIRPRRHSFNYSFCPPETISDDVSVGMSWLESRLVAFNDRYDFILNNSPNTDEQDLDCLTIYGNSV